MKKIHYVIKKSLVNPIIDEDNTTNLRFTKIEVDETPDKYRISIHVNNLYYFMVEYSKKDRNFLFSCIVWAYQNNIPLDIEVDTTFPANNDSLNYLIVANISDRGLFDFKKYWTNHCN